MKKKSLLVAGAILATTFALSSMNTLIRAEDAAPTLINPGSVPNTSKINPGVTQEFSSNSTDVSKIPTPEQARAALMTPVSKQPSTGGALPATTGSRTHDRPGTSDTGAAATPDEPPPSGPIGSFGQTTPANFSNRNDILDHVPTMAIPLPLTDEQRKKIYDAVMAENSQAPAGADMLEPASELSPDQALNGMHPLPASVRDIDGVARLYYVKAKEKVFLVEPAVRTVVGQITPQ
jgi:hypothetical protein